MTQLLRPYQVTGSTFLREPIQAKLINPNRLLADAAGVGKTRQAISAALLTHAKRIIVCCPAVALYVWRDEFRVMGYKGTIDIIQNSKTDVRGLGGDRVIILSYGLLSNMEPSLVRNLGADLVILDEVHYLKGPSNRAKRVFGPKFDGNHGIIDNAVVWALSGTPVLNHAGELYNFVVACFPEFVRAVADTSVRGSNSNTLRVMSRHAFEDLTCHVKDTIYGRRIVGTNNNSGFLKGLRVKMKPYILRRTKEAVLPELPKLQTVVTPLPLTKPVDRTAMKKLDADLQKELLDGLGDDPSLDRIAARIKESGMHLAAERHAMGLAKVAACTEWADDFLISSGEKLILFAWHKEVIRKLEEGLADHMPLVITGSTRPDERNVAVYKFQSDEQHRVIICQTIAAGVAITLTAASTVGHVETDWVPANIYQASSRAHRFGQTKAVTAHLLTVAGSIDQRILQQVKRKMEEIDELFSTQESEAS